MWTHDARANCVKVQACMCSRACGVTRVGVCVHAPVSTHGCVCISQSCDGTGLGPQVERNMLPEGIKAG